MKIKDYFSSEAFFQGRLYRCGGIVSALVLAVSVIGATSCGRKSQAQEEEATLKLVGYELDLAGLFKAVENDDIQALKIFKSRKFDFNEQDSTGRTAVHVAAGSGSIRALDFIVKNGGDIEAVDQDGVSPIMAAAKAAGVQNGEAITYLLENGASAIRKDKIGKFALIHAIDGKSPEVINLLAAESRELLDTGLLYAADMDQHEAIPMLVKYGASVYARNEGKTALMLAAERGNDRAAKALLDEGANLYAVSDDGKLAKEYAQGNDRVLAVLVESEKVDAENLATDQEAGALALDWSEDEMESLIQKAMDRSPMPTSVDQAVQKGQPAPLKNKAKEQVVINRIQGKSVPLELSGNVAVSEKVTMAAYAEKSLPIKIHADESGKVEIYDLRENQPAPDPEVEIAAGSQIGMTGLRVKQIKKKVVNNKLTGGEDKELVTLMIEDEKTGHLRELYAGYESQAAEAIAVLKINETGEYLIIEREDEFYDLKGTAYKVMDVNNEEVIIENIGTGQLSMLPLMGIKK